MVLGLVNQRLRPECGILPVERHEFAVTRVARDPARFAVQHEREQAMDFGFVGQELNERAHLENESRRTSE